MAYKFTSGALALLVFCLPALAEPELDTARPQDPRIAEILSNLPTEAEIDDIMSDVPDMTRLMTGMMDIVTDEDNHATLERVAGRLESRLEVIEQAASPETGEMPDINALMREVMMMSTDKEMMGDLLGLAFQVNDLMEDVTEEIEDKSKED